MPKTTQATEKKEATISKKREYENLTVFREVYPVHEPYVFAAIVRDPETHKMMYETIEPTLQKSETEQLEEIKTVLMDELDVNLKQIKNREMAEKLIKQKTVEVIRKYRFNIPTKAIDKLTYYVIRDFVGFGKIDPLMKDHLIEDVSADGVNVPIYVWHRVYESLPTNIAFRDGDKLNSFVARLAYLAGRNISIASPILDASLPDGSRIQLSYGSEVTTRGPTFTIRRFKADPLTISDLIRFNTVSAEMAAYLWYIIEKRASIIVAGGVASGKTTMLNCLSMFIKPEMKIVSVEDTQELNLPHENWIPSVVRLRFGTGNSGNITMFDLLKAAVRQRPDYIIVGEVRGKEAYTLFQAMATGHLGMNTIHAESAESVISRLESEPMNIPRSLIAMTDAIMVMTRVEIDGKPARRAVTTTEILNFNKNSKSIKTQKVFEWTPKEDRFAFSGHSSILEKQRRKTDIKKADIKQELHRRKTVLEWMIRQNIRRHTDVANVIRDYYANPDRVYQKARVGVK